MPNPLYDALLAPHRASAAPFITRPGEEAISYAAFVEGALRAADVLSECGLKPGDRLAMQAGKSVEALQVYAACVIAGVIFLPLNTAYTAAEIDYFISDAEPGLFICDPADETALTPIAQRHGAQLLTLSTEGTGGFMERAATMPGASVPAGRDKEDVAALLYTSGTTGRSKGAMLTHENLLSNAEILAREWRFTSEDRLLHALPIYHVHGLFVATNITLLAGGSMIFLPGFNAQAVLEALPQATAMMGVPTFYTRLLNEDGFTGELAGAMRLFVSGSAPLLSETHISFETRTGHRILERYGMTETGMNTTNPYDGERRAGAVGFPLEDVELRITDGEQAVEVAPGDIGMIEVRGPNVFKGYWRMPEKTREEKREDGFFITGDLGRIDADGYVHIVGRNKDLIISGGFNVYPKEVELVLDEAAWVRESAVIGVPHPDFGEAVVAILTPEAGAEPDVAALGKEVSRTLAKYKQPKKMIVIDALPRNTMGKVQKNILRERHRDLFSMKR